MTTVAVFLSTGAQGSSVVRALSSQFGKSITIRAFTRDPDAASTKAVFAKLTNSANIVPTGVNVSDPASVRQGLKGVNAVFLATHSMHDRDQEAAYGKLAIRIADEEGVQLFVLSSLPSPSKLSNGKYVKMSNWESKASILDALEQSRLKWVSVQPGSFCENFATFNCIKKTEEDGYEIVFPVIKPETRVGWTWVANDVGSAVSALIKAHLDNSHTDIFYNSHPVAAFQASFEDFGKLVSQRTGKKVTYRTPPQSFNEGATEMGHFANEYGFFKAADLPSPELVRIGARFSTIEQFVDAALIPHIQKLG
ncbi:hypothetical protein OC845_003383 [Tilletia horrida]|nr:hypothetical protein OC845_003383 [Tilletia horrida]